MSVTKPLPRTDNGTDVRPPTPEDLLRLPGPVARWIVQAVSDEAAPPGPTAAPAPAPVPAKPAPWVPDRRRPIMLWLLTAAAVVLLGCWLGTLYMEPRVNPNWITATRPDTAATVRIIAAAVFASWVTPMVPHRVVRRCWLWLGPAAGVYLFASVIFGR